ncbi:DUF732 domain-containing protein [Microbacterium sp. R1]|uniref:DUF732 domain-containing protein n=1 Tax=Microbacterium sp. R1 TaxID=322686 RepID=UPI0011CA430B|nr:MULTISPECIES: DUF732 domain-containing protein [Terrabacteria group]MBE7952902.1 DUF732 domain-containing protein [Microbacterium sp. R1]TXF80968.1 DUF732 domain-containing protein [Alkalicoccus halolimnae]
MKRPAVAAVAAVLLLALAGCADGGNAATETDRSSQRTAEDAPTGTPEPLAAESPTTSPSSSAELDARFLDVVRGELLPGSGITNATDEQLIAAGHDGCEQVKAGVPLEQIRLVDGEQPTSTGYYMDTSAIFFGAQQVYCPETIETID